jgi:hypothetical protein
MAENPMAMAARVVRDTTTKELFLTNPADKNLPSGKRSPLHRSSLASEHQAAGAIVVHENGRKK